MSAAEASAPELAAAAMLAHRQGNMAEAERLCRLALEADPGIASALVHLSVLLRNQGQFAESSDLARRAIARNPSAADGYIQLGLSQLGAGRPVEAAEALSKAISLNPSLSALHYNMGLALENLGRGEEAKAAFREATRLAPRDVRARLSLGSLLLAEEKVQQARAQAETALGINPGSAEAYLLKAKTLVAENRGAEAEIAMRRALALDETQSFGHTMLGFRLLQTGAFDQAEKEFLRSLELDPQQGVAFFGITQARKMRESDRELLERMLHTAGNIPLTLEQSGYLHFALAKTFDNLGEFPRAMEHYHQAHRDAGQYRYSLEPFDAATYEKDFEATRELYTPELLSRPPGGFDSDLPILIVGMMRSGTTLTEQILSSHSRIAAAGEHLFWARRAGEAELAGRIGVDMARAAELGREYCRELEAIAPKAARVTDKLPGNYSRLGLIHMALPNAKILHCRRAPIDTALSIYFTANPTAPAFSHSPDGIVAAYKSYLRLMDHWRATLPSDRFYEVQYEELIRTPETVIRGMLEFLGLAWDEACLRHDRNAKEVRTPSLWQVRQPLYTTSIDKWRNYESVLGAFSELLELP